MREAILLLLVIGIGSRSIGQRYKTTSIINKADSLIISVVGQKIFNEHYQLDTTSVKDPVQIAIDRDAGIRRISLTKKINRHFKFISVDYIFYVKKCDSPFVRTGLIFDKYLNLQYPIDTSFIPKFVLQNTKDTFLSRGQALEIAKSIFRKRGLRIETRIFHDPRGNIYIWEVTNILFESQGGKSVEHVSLNAENGKIIDFYEALQGQLH